MLGLGLSLTGRAARGGGSAPPIQRVTPPGLPALPITPTAVNGVGDVAVSRSVIQFVETDHAARYAPGTIYVKPSTGNDANAGTQAAPVATLSNALRTKLASRVIIDEPCTLEHADLRNTDASNAQAAYPNGIIKHVGTTHPVTITVAGPSLPSLTYTAHGTVPDVWTTTLSALTGLASPHRLMRTDQTDTEGQHKELYRAPTLTALAAASTGWYLSSRFVSSVATATDTINVQSAVGIFVSGGGLGLANGDAVRLSGIGTATAPGGLAFATTYYVRDVTTSSLKLAATPGGAAIDITSAGTGQLIVHPAA
jgi:hypothetical protein